MCSEEQQSMVNKVSQPTQGKGGEKDMAFKAKGDMDKAKKLLRDTSKSCYSIAEETGCAYNSVLNWAKKLRKPAQKSTVVVTEGREPPRLPDDFTRAKPELGISTKEGCVTVFANPKFDPELVKHIAPAEPFMFRGRSHMSFSKEECTIGELEKYLEYVLFMAKTSGARTFNIDTTIKSGE